MSVVLSALGWLGYATAGVTVTAIATRLLLKLFPVRSPAIQRFAWLLVLLPGVVAWRMTVVLPILPTAYFSGVDLRPESDGDRLMSEGAKRGHSLKQSNGQAVFLAATGRTVGHWVCVVLLVGWLAGMVVLAARWAWVYAAFVKGLPRPLAPADEWLKELQDACDEFGIPGAICLHVTDGHGPALCLAGGGYRLVVPEAAWDRFSTRQRRSILRHELAHYVRGDLWKSLLVRLLAWPQWFNPLAWLAVRRFEEAAECACDDAVVAAEPEDAFDYLRALLDLGRNDFSASTLQAAAHGGSLERRVRRLLSPARKDPALKNLLVIAAALSVATFGFAQVRFASARSPVAENDSARILPVLPPVVSLIANGGFEELRAEVDDPKGWFATRLPQTKGHFLLAVSPLLARTGRRSAYVEIGDKHPISPVHYNWATDVQGWQAGEAYELSGWIKVENVRRPAFIMAQFWSKDRVRIGGATTQVDYPVAGTNDWTRVSTRLKVPEGTTVVLIRAGLSSEGNPRGKAWFDDLAFVRIAD